MRFENTPPHTIFCADSFAFMFGYSDFRPQVHKVTSIHFLDSEYLLLEYNYILNLRKCPKTESGKTIHFY